MNYQQILVKSSNQLKLKNIKSYKIDSELLLAKALKVRREEVLLNLNKTIDQNALKKFNYYLNLRKQYKISRERVRQIENKAFEKLQKQMLLLAKSKNLLPAN